MQFLANLWLLFLTFFVFLIFSNFMGLFPHVKHRRGTKSAIALYVPKPLETFFVSRIRFLIVYEYCIYIGELKTLEDDIGSKEMHWYC